MNFKMATLNTIKGWSENDVLAFLDKNNLSDYKTFATSKGIDGYKLLSLSEGIIALWRPKLDPKKLLSAVDDLKTSYFQANANQVKSTTESNILNICKSNEASYKRVKPKIPVRKDSLKNYSESIKSEKSVMDKNTLEEKKCSNSINSDSVTNHVDFNKMVAPQSFLYSATLKKVATKVNPYAPMGSIINEKKDNIKKSNNNEKSVEYICVPETIKMINIEEGNYMTIINDRGYYEMNSNRKSSTSNEYWDINVDFDENMYEELLFKIDNLDVTEIRKKKKGIINRVLRIPAAKKDKKEEAVSECVESAENYTDRNVDNVNFQRLHMTNDRGAKRFYSSKTNNYEVSATNSSDVVKQIDKYEQIPEYEILESFEEDGDKKNSATKEQKTTNTKINETTNHFKRPKHFFVVNDIEFYEEPPNMFSNDSFYNMDLNVVNENVYESADTIKEEQKEMRKSRDYDEPTIDVEDYLEPRQILPLRDENVMDTLADEILKLFDDNMESRIQKKDTTSAIPNKDYSICSEATDMSSKECEEGGITPIIQKPPTPKKPLYLPKPLPRRKLPSYPDVTPKKNLSNLGEDASKPILSYSTGNVDRKPTSLSSINMSQNISQCEEIAIHRPFEKLQKWNETLRNSIRKKRDNVKTNMAERPLPVPVENEFYYMDVSRQYAEKLLEGHADGTFILRPSSQSLHAYTVTLIYHDRIYNIGCRRRQDGRLALGFTKASEQSFLTINDLIEHYYNEKLVLLVDGMNVGSTVLKKLNA